MRVLHPKCSGALAHYISRKTNRHGWKGPPGSARADRRPSSWLKLTHTQSTHQPPNTYTQTHTHTLQSEVHTVKIDCEIEIFTRASRRTLSDDGTTQSSASAKFVRVLCIDYRIYMITRKKIPSTDRHFFPPRFLLTFQLDLQLQDESGGDISSFITNGEWELLGNYSLHTGPTTAPTPRPAPHASSSAPVRVRVSCARLAAADGDAVGMLQARAWSAALMSCMHVFRSVCGYIH